MKRLVCTLSSLFLFASASVAQEIDDSSYESLFKAAYKCEMQNRLTKATLEALVKYDALDLMSLVEPPYRRQASGESWGAQQRAAEEVHIVAEHLFREKRIDEGINLIKTMLPPQAPDEGMFAKGYISEALLEQKRFEEAWQIADCGLPPERVNNICRYIQRTIAKTFHEDERSFFAFSADSAHFNLKYNLGLPEQERLFPPLVLNEANTKIYRAEANRAFEELQKRPKPARDARAVRYAIAEPTIPVALAALGRSDEAYALAKDENHRDRVLRTILYERSKNGTPEEVEQWFQKAREFYKAEGIPGRNDPRRNILPTPWPATTNYIECCIEFGRYLDAMDAIENHGGNNARWGDARPGEYFDKLLQHNVETNYRYNSKELVERQIKFYQRITADGPIWTNHTGGQRSRYIAFIGAQLNLGLVDDAWESLQKIADDRKSFTHWGRMAFPSVILTSLGEIVFYVHKHKTPEEANRIEAAGFELFSNIDNFKERGVLASYLINYYRDLAMRFKQDGNAEMSERYLKMAVEQAEKEQVVQEEKADQRLSFSQMENVAWRLAISGEIEKALEIAHRLEPHHQMPHVHLTIAEKYERAGETEKAKAALKKAFETISRVEKYYPVHGDYYRGMITLAIKFDDKELFYEIMNAFTEIAEREKWFEGTGLGPSGWLSAMIQQLAVYGDKEHALFEQAEKYADGFENAGAQAELYLSLGVSHAMFDDHVTARRLLKKGIESRQKEQHKSNLSTFCAPVIEARSYEKR